MVESCYIVLFWISIVFTVLYVYMWHKHFNVNLSLIFVFVPLAAFGYVFKSQAVVLEEYILAQKIIYLGGCFLLLFITWNVFEMCKIQIPKWIKLLLVCASMVVYLSVMTIGESPLFYKEISAVWGGDGLIVSKTYGPWHSVFYVLVMGCFISSFTAIIYSFIKKKDVPRITVMMLFIPEFVTVVFFFGEKIVGNKMELAPFGYVIAQFVYLLIAHRTTMYDISDTSIESIVETGDTGFISLDSKMRYLGSNRTAVDIFEGFENLRIDQSIKSDASLAGIFLPWIDAFSTDENNDKFYYKKGERIYLVDVNYLFDAGKKRGFQFVISDDTQNQKYIEVINRYNADLERDVEKKTKEIIQINDIFGKNVSPQIRDYLLKGNIHLGGEKLFATVMFCDIRGFTTLSENMPSEKVVQLLNEYFTGLEKCIARHNGVINKYIGDAVMALFGVPIPSERHELDAFLAAKDMKSALVEMNESFAAKGLPALRFGIGLHSGTLLAGNIGTETRMEYTVIGDTVNTASRIEGLCKNYKTDLLVSETTAEALMKKHGVNLNFVDNSDIRGRVEKVGLWTD